MKRRIFTFLLLYLWAGLNLAQISVPCANTSVGAGLTWVHSNQTSTENVKGFYKLGTKSFVAANTYAGKAARYNPQYKVAPSLYNADKAQSIQIKQTRPARDLSSDQVTALSRAYQDKALWFKEMPHFNRDSTVFYFDKAALLLQNLSLIHISEPTRPY